jgi:glutamine amidotransferase
MIAYEPLTVDEPWQALRTGELRVYVDGQEVWCELNPQTKAFAAAERVALTNSVRAS